MTAACSQPRRWSVWLTHHQFSVYLSFAAAGTLDQIVHGNNYIDGLVLALFVGIIAVNVALFRHASILCERCMSEFPVDGQAQAEKRRNALAYTHNIDNRMWKLAGLWLAAIFLASQWNILTSLPWLVCCVDLRARVHHRRLEPWCPWCRHGGDDDEESVDAPVPTGEATR